MKTQNWHNNILIQLSSPTRLESDTPVCSAPITTAMGAASVGKALLNTCDILKCGSTIIKDGLTGYCQALAMLTCGASPDLYNAISAQSSAANRQGMMVATALRLGMVLVTAPALTDNAQTAYYITYGMQGAPENIKAGIMTLMISDVNGKAGAKIAISEIGKARGYTSAFGIDLNPLDLISSAVSDVGDIVSDIPGVGPVVDFFGSQAKDFANTSLGKVALTAFAGVSYAALAPALGILGPQLAAVTFAIPGLAKGDSFDQAWIEAFLDRLKQLAEYLGGEAVGEIAGQFQPAIDGLTSQAAKQGIDLGSLADGMQKIGLSTDTLNKAANSLGVRTDIMQEALDYITKESSMAVDSTVTYAMGIIPTVIPATPGRSFDTPTGNMTGDSRDAITADPIFLQKPTVEMTVDTSIRRADPYKVNAPKIASALTKPTISVTAAQVLIKANPPKVTAPLPAKKLHWWTRLGAWAKKEKVAKFGDDGFFSNLATGGAAPQMTTKVVTTGKIKLKQPPPTIFETQTIKPTLFAPGPTMVQAAPTPAPTQGIVVAKPVVKIHWWTKVAAWFKRKPVASANG